MKKIYLLLFVITLLYSSIVRTWGLNDKGLFFYDEAYLALETRYMRDTASAALSQQPNIKELLANTSGMQLHYGRPGFNFSSFLTSLLVGYHDHTNFYLSAFLGTAAVASVFLIGYKFYSFSAGLLSATFLAVNSYHIYYSRSGFAEAGGGFLFLLSVFFYLLFLKKLQIRFLFLTGVSLGITYTFGYKYLLILPIFLLDQLLKYFVSRKKLSAVIRYCLILIVSFCAVLILTELAFRLVQVFYSATSTATYFDQLRNRYSFAGYFSFKDWYAYFYYFYKSESLGFFLLLLGSIVFWLFTAIKEKIFASKLIFLVAFTHLFFYTVYSANTGGSHGGTFVRFTRSLAVSLPVMALATGIFVDRLITRLKWNQPWAVMIFLVVIFLTQFPKNQEIVNLRSGYKEATEYLQSKRERQVFAFLNTPIWRFYLGKEIYSPRNADHLKALSQEKKIHFLVVDALKYSWGDVPSQNYSYLNGFLANRQPEKIIRNQFWKNALVLGEGFDLGRAGAMGLDPSVGEIQVYHLE